MVTRSASPENLDDAAHLLRSSSERVAPAARFGRGTARFNPACTSRKEITSRCNAVIFEVDPELLGAPSLQAPIDR